MIKPSTCTETIVEGMLARLQNSSQPALACNYDTSGTVSGAALKTCIIHLGLRNSQALRTPSPSASSVLRDNPRDHHRDIVGLATQGFVSALITLLAERHPSRQVPGAPLRGKRQRARDPIWSGEPGGV